MTVFVREEDDVRWREFDLKGQTLKDAARALLEAEAHSDSDGGYHLAYEFDDNGHRYWAYAEYDGWDLEYDLHGDLALFAFGTRDELKKHSSDFVSASRSPHRDYLELDQHFWTDHDGGWHHKSSTPYDMGARFKKLGLVVDNPGFCIVCGKEVDGVEPDARGINAGIVGRTRCGIWGGRIVDCRVLKSS